ncbi:MAG TPA: alpha/beta hydrolase [Chloroflexia bacterium]|nr:alpha/beta hydrolase [Chloroflexia bacterium]
MQLEIITHRPAGPAAAPPLLFVHGAWHGAWCWEPHFLPYFAQHGFVAHAVSLRHHGNSDPGGTLRWLRGADYAADVAQAVATLGTRPVLVGHSMGGYVVQKYLETATVPATILLASVPPRGALGATLRTLRRHPLALLKTVAQFRLWPIVATPRLAQDALFSATMPEVEVAHYFAQLQDEAYLAYLDMMLLNLPRPRRIARTPMLVLGGADDAIITPADHQSTGRAYGATVEIFPHMAHDMMLEADWQAVADRMIAWLRSVPGLT